MAEKFKNIGLFYQKQYFKGIVYDAAGNYKQGAKNTIAARNKLLLSKHSIVNTYFCTASPENQFELKTQYPGIITGIGMKHETSIEGELKLGMYFDYTNGMPCVPASSVKGALRAAFPQFEKHKKTSSKIKDAKAYILHQMLAEINPKEFNPKKNDELLSKVDKTNITQIEEEIFDGKKTISDNENEVKKVFLSIYEKDIFHDAFIVKGDSKGRILADDAITHHPSPLKNPNPVLFLKIPSGVSIQFNFDLKNGAILTAKEKHDLFEQIILYYGLGAKTNVGYGQFDKIQQ